MARYQSSVERIYIGFSSAIILKIPTPRIPAALNDGGFPPAARPGHCGSSQNQFRPGLTYRHQEEPANCCAFSHSIFGAGGGGVSLCLWTPPPPHPTPHSSSILRPQPPATPCQRASLYCATEQGVRRRFRSRLKPTRQGNCYVRQKILLNHACFYYSLFLIQKIF